jgi:hypothetical protein
MASGSGSGGAASSGSAQNGIGGGIFAGSGTSGQGGAGAGCVPPDMLIVLDRTMSMHKAPDGAVPADTPAGHMESKWYIAIEAVETLTASLDQTIRFGLELFPRDPGMSQCITLSQRIQGATATNTQCEQGEVPVQPGLGTAGAINTILDPETTLLCRSTPIGASFITAKDTLAAIATPDRPQFVVLITDGNETCDQMLPLQQVQALAQSGVKSYAIGFDASGAVVDAIDKPMLNDLACAGQTSTGFPAGCVDDGAGNYRWDATSGTDVFLLAENGTALNDLLKQLGGEVCCDCVPN